jgi:transcriptional regulator with XRE-family HTH domain
MARASPAIQIGMSGKGAPSHGHLNDSSVVLSLCRILEQGSRMTADGPHRLDVAMGQRIRERRCALGMSQGDLARALGITFQQVQKYERGANRVSFSRLMQVVDALNCHLTDLTEGLDPERPAREIDQVRRLIAEDGAYELLEAYAALRGKPLQRALLLHAKALAGVVDPSQK